MINIFFRFRHFYIYALHFFPPLYVANFTSMFLHFVCSTKSVWNVVMTNSYIHFDAAIRRAEFVAEHPFPPKAVGRKVCCLCCPFAYLLPDASSDMRCVLVRLPSVCAEKAREQEGGEGGERVFGRTPISHVFALY